jgi:hypothetical protein
MPRAWSSSWQQHRQSFKLQQRASRACGAELVLMVVKCVVCSIVLLLRFALGLLYSAATRAQFLCLPTASAPATAPCWMLCEFTCIRLVWWCAMCVKTFVAVTRWPSALVVIGANP